ncbi:MAG: class I SAM-dependent methyltransferase [Balneolaceae bacterium]|nr:class I SAM-dependent methyltransferase [Balneolaceae bacterium]
MSRFDEEAKTWDTPESQERAEQIASAIRSEVTLSKNMTAFEYGCGTGQLSFELRDHLKSITLADNSSGMLDVLKDKIEKNSATTMKPVQMDLTRDPLPDQRFDLVYTAMTLHHIPDTDEILKKFNQLLNPGGILCIADLDKEDGSFHGHEVDDVHKGFEREELKNRAEKLGFSNITFTTAYQMEREIDDEGTTKMFPIFLMKARKL